MSDERSHATISSAEHFHDNVPIYLGTDNDASLSWEVAPSGSGSLLLSASASNSVLDIGSDALPWSTRFHGSLQVDGVTVVPSKLGALPYLVLPDGWDATWQAALAASGTTPAWFVAIGDSYTQGSVSSDFNATSWFARLRAALLARGYGLGADFIGPFNSLLGVASYNGTPPWVITDTSAKAKIANGYGFAGGIRWISGPSNPMASVTLPLGTTSYDLLIGNPFVVAAGQTWAYNTDGGADTTVPISALSSSVIYRIAGPTGLSAGSQHTVNLTTQTADNTVEVYGVVAYKTTATGLRFANCGASGARAIDFMDNDALQPQNRHKVFQGVVSGATGPFGGTAKIAGATIALGINDAQAAYQPDLFGYALDNLVSSLRRQNDQCSIAIVANPWPDGVHSDITPSLTNPESWPLYVRVMGEVATARRCAFVNMNAKWGPNGLALGFVGVGQEHPIDAGHADIATVLGGIF